MGKSDPPGHTLCCQLCLNFDNPPKTLRHTPLIFWEVAASEADSATMVGSWFQMGMRHGNREYLLIRILY